MAEISIKMTPQEAIRRIEEHNRIHFATEGGRCLLITEALKMAVAALERQTPKKVTHEATLPHCSTCPTCNTVVDRFEKWGESTVRITYNHCQICGQALDWEEETENAPLLPREDLPAITTTRAILATSLG